MAISELLLPEFDQEMQKTRAFLERVPEGKGDFRPHEKSMALGRLAGHVAELPGWGAHTLSGGGLDLAPGGQPALQPNVMTTRARLLEDFDKGVADTRATLSGVSDESFQEPWSLLRGGKAMFTLPRYAVFRSMVLNHTIHHRAQLGVYLRLNGVPLPPAYGPSADEGR
jgi:uncharacterized damage-inducible protein DinB